MYSTIPENMTHIEGYSMTRAKTWSRLKYSRIVLLAKEGLLFNIEHNRMNDEVSSIWLRVGGRGRRGLLIGGVYREHTLIRQEEPNNFGEQDHQEKRWKLFL